MKTVSLLNDHLLFIQFTYDPRVVAQVRCLPPGRKWAPEINGWVCPISADALTALRRWGFEIKKDVLKWEHDQHVKMKPGFPVYAVSGLKKKLRPFQLEGVGFFCDHGGRCLCGDEMGLGKTVQALAWLQYKDTYPAVVVCPASLKGNWEKECLAWTTLEPSVLSGTTIDSSMLKLDLLIINYDILEYWLPAFSNIKTVILDECHLCKNPKANRTKAVKELCRGKEHVIALSGTPIINRPIEFFTVLNILAPGTFGSYFDYIQRFCDAKANAYGGGLDVTGSSNPDDLNMLLDSIMIRRLKKDVLKDLPAKTRTTVPIALEREKVIYDRAVTDALQEWEADPLSDITQIHRIRQAVMEAKFDMCCEWIDNFLETGRKLVVFDIHHKTTDLLTERYSKIPYVTLDGRTDPRVRSRAVEMFQNDPNIKLLFGNIQVAGVGLTLTAAQDAVFLELPWTPGELDQAEDRIHRIGQKEAVNIYYLIARDTIEDDMIKLINEKRKIVRAVLDGTCHEGLNIQQELIERLKGKLIKC